MINFQLGREREERERGRGGERERVCACACVCVWGGGLSPLLLNFALEYSSLGGSNNPGGAEI